MRLITTAGGGIPPHTSLNKDQMSNSDVPQAVKDAARLILERDGGTIIHIGRYKGGQIYSAFIEGAQTGFPTVYSFDGVSAVELPTSESLRLLSLLCED